MDDPFEESRMKVHQISSSSLLWKFVNKQKRLLRTLSQSLSLCWTLLLDTHHDRRRSNQNLILNAIMDLLILYYRFCMIKTSEIYDWIKRSFERHLRSYYRWNNLSRAKQSDRHWGIPARSWSHKQPSLVNLFFTNYPMNKNDSNHFNFLMFKFQLWN